MGHGEGAGGGPVMTIQKGLARPIPAGRFSFLLHDFTEEEW